MISKASIFIVLFCFLISFQSYGQAERDTLFYELDTEKVHSAIVTKMDGKEPRYFIDIRLKEDYREKYAQLTEDNTNIFLAVVLEGEVIASSLPVIKAKISSGRFSLGYYKKEETAKKVKQQILNESEMDSI